MKKVKLGILCLLAGVVLTACNKESDGKSDYKEKAFGLDLLMVAVEGGTFDMGSTIGLDSDASDDEAPVHQVTLSSYCISKYEITQAQWKAVMGTTIQQQAGSSKLYGEGDNYPMYYVSWEDAKAFCDKLSQKTGMTYALPTEAQWEFAARGGTKSQGYKYSGSNTVDDVAWYNVNGKNTTHTVGSKAPNELGLYDMSGNVWELCADWYGVYSSIEATNPTGPDRGGDRVCRGGSWYSDDFRARVSYRDYDKPDSRDSRLGFRVVRLLK